MAPRHVSAWALQARQSGSDGSAAGPEACSRAATGAPVRSTMGAPIRDSAGAGIGGAFGAASVEFCSAGGAAAAAAGEPWGGWHRAEAACQVAHQPPAEGIARRAQESRVRDHKRRI